MPLLTYLVLLGNHCQEQRSIKILPFTVDTLFGFPQYSLLISKSCKPMHLPQNYLFVSDVLFLSHLCKQKENYTNLSATILDVSTHPAFSG